MAATEREHQQRAFELYYSQGGKRSHERVATELGVSVASVKSWSRSFNWAKRLAERDAAVARQVADQTIKSEVDELSRNKKIVQMALVKVAKAINADKVRVQIGDLDRLIRLQSYLDGYVEGQTWESLSPEDLARRFFWVLKNVSTYDLRIFDEEFTRLEAEYIAQHPERGLPEATGPGIPK